MNYEEHTNRREMMKISGNGAFVDGSAKWAELINYMLCKLQVNYQ